MNKILTIAKGELYRYFISPLAYVYLICFLLLNSSFSLYFGGIFTSGNASLKPMFDFLPWLYLIFIPGIAMRLWAEEFKSGTILQLMTLPVSIESFVWGKFLASWAFCTLGLALTFPFIITLNILGAPDNGIIFCSYLGAFLISGAMLAISQTASALSKNQVIALVIAVILNLMFFLSGLEYILGFFRNFAPDYIVEMIASFSFLTHTTNYSLGLFELSSFIFLVSIIVLFNFLTVLIISFKTSGTASRLQATSSFGCLVAALLCFIAFIGINLFSKNTLEKFYLDFTEEKVFSISDSTKKILKNLQSPVTARLYYSPILGERDERMRKSYEIIKNLLQNYQTLSKGRFSYLLYNPEPLSITEDRAIQAGLQGLPVPDLNAAAYFGISFSNENGQTSAIPFLPLERQSFLEQDLTEKIYLLEHKKKTLGIYTSLPLFGKNNGATLSQPWQITKELKKYYNVIEANTPELIEKTDLLMIVHPQKMPKELEDAIFNYSTSGKKILAFFDIAAESLLLTGPQTSASFSSNYGSLPQKWGFHFFNQQTVADLNNATQITLDEANYKETTQDLIQFYLTPNSFYPGLPETNGLKRLLMTSASVFMPLKDAPIYFVPLMQASSQSELISSDFVTQNIHPSEILRSFKADAFPKYLAAHIISQTEKTPFELIVVGDSDMLYDSFWSKTIQIGNRFYTIPLLDNTNFVLNALDTLSGEDTLLSLRGKSKKLRPFTTLDQKQKQKMVKFKIKEGEILKQLDFSKRGIQEIWGKKIFEGRENFTPEELSLLTKIKKELIQKRQDLFNIRKEINAEMLHIELLIKFFNIYAIPLLLLLTILISARRSFQLSFFSHFSFNRQFIELLCLCLLCLLLGFGSIFASPANLSVSNEGLPLFPDLEKKINLVTQLSLKTAKQTLSFVKKDNLWVSQQHPDFLVNQNRIRSLLSALIQASIYEKKTDKLENLASFGLLPITNPESKAVAISLFSNKEKLLAFEVGDYNIELGRGTLGAYIRKIDKFQVWLAAIELVDLNIDYHYWSFANLWNLAFGRFTSINGSKNIDYVANIVSLLLNTELTQASSPKDTKEIFSLTATGEDFTNLSIVFSKDHNHFYVKFIFKGDIRNTLLQNFANTMNNKLFKISETSVKKIQHALQQKTS